MKKGIAMMLAALSLLCLSGCGVMDWPVWETEPVMTRDLAYLPESLFRRTNSLSLSLTDSDGAVGGPYLFLDIPEHMSLGTYTILDEANLNKYDRWLTIDSGNGSTRLTVYDGYRDILCLENGDTISYYQDDDGTTFETLRQDFDTMEYLSKRQISFHYYSPARDPLREFASTVYPQFRMGLTEGSRFRFENYDLMYCQVQEQTDTTVTGEIGYFAIAQEKVLPKDSEPGTGQYDGWYFVTEPVKLELQEDGAWHQVEEFGLTITDPTQPTDEPTE